MKASSGMRCCCCCCLFCAAALVRDLCFLPAAVRSCDLVAAPVAAVAVLGVTVDAVTVDADAEAVAGTAVVFRWCCSCSSCWSTPGDEVALTVVEPSDESSLLPAPAVPTTTLRRGEAGDWGGRIVAADADSLLSCCCCCGGGGCMCAVKALLPPVALPAIRVAATTAALLWLLDSRPALICCAIGPDICDSVGPRFLTADLMTGAPSTSRLRIVPVMVVVVAVVPAADRVVAVVWTTERGDVECPVVAAVVLADVLVVLAVLMAVCTGAADSEIIEPILEGSDSSMWVCCGGALWPIDDNGCCC